MAGDALTVRRATADDVEHVLGLLDAAARWAAAIGRANWAVPFPRRLVEANVDAGELFLADLAGEAVGAVTLLWDDPVIWGDDGRDGLAGYAHRLVVRRDHAGSGLGARLLAWADDQVRATRRDRLRLDVVTYNAPLRRYYEQAAFTHVRDASGVWTDRSGTRHEWVTSLYERRCAPTAPRSDGPR